MNKKNISFSLMAIIVIAGSIVAFNYYNRPTEKITTKINAVLAKVTPEEIVKESDGIIVGTVKDMQTVKAPSDLRTGEEDIVTNVNISVERYLSNSRNLALSDITVQVIGGTIGGETMVAEDSPVFERGQRVIVFLKQKDKSIFTVYGWSQGKYTINNGNVADGEKEQNTFRNIFGNDMTLDEFEKQVKSLDSSFKTGK